jgi:hypothetical protein
VREPSSPSAPSFGADESSVGVWIVRVQNVWANLGSPLAGALVPGVLVSALRILLIGFHAPFSVDNIDVALVSPLNSDRQEVCQFC